MPAPASPSLRTDKIVSVPFDENTYLLWLEGRADCVVVDPGLQPKKILEKLSEHGLTPATLLITHGHSDHIAGNAELKSHWPECPIVIGEGDAAKLTDPGLNLSRDFGFELTSPPADVMLAEGDRYEAAGMMFDVLHTPGHSAGHVTFVTDIAGQRHAIAGDVLFRGGVGRSDFSDGDFDQLRQSIHHKLFPLGDKTTVYPGHGPTTTIGHERKHNPFVGRAAGYEV